VLVVPSGGGAFRELAGPCKALFLTAQIFFIHLFSLVIIRRHRHPIGLTQPAGEVHIGAALGTERFEGSHHRAAADGAGGLFAGAGRRQINGIVTHHRHFHPGPAGRPGRGRDGRASPPPNPGATCRKHGWPPGRRPPSRSRPVPPRRGRQRGPY